MITNKDVLMKQLQLFAHGISYQDESIFVNREKSKQEFQEATKDSSARVLIILSDLLGTGKTFLVDQATRFIPEKINSLLIKWVSETELKLRSKDPLIVIDEIDEKTVYRVIQANLGLVNSKLDELPKLLVLVGDYILRNQKVLSMFSNVSERKYIKLEPLDRQFFLKAMKARVKKFLDTDEEVEFFDPDLLDYLIPRTEIGIATFREVLTILQGLVSELPLDTNKCCISGKEARFWFEKKAKGIFEEERSIFYKWLIGYLVKEYETSRQNQNYTMKVLETSTLRELCPIENIKSDEEYEERILIPFAKTNVLKSLGIPFLRTESTVDRYPGPYLPSVKTFLDAKYGEGT